MLTCETAGHLWGSLGKCVMCGARAPRALAPTADPGNRLAPDPKGDEVAESIAVAVWITRWTEAQHEIAQLRQDTWLLMSAVRGHTPDLNTQSFDEVIATQKAIDAAVKRAQTSLQEAHARKSGTAPSGAVSHDASAERGPEPAL